MACVCCLCGDVGFSEHLFRCSKCLNRFQHSYCSNYTENAGSKNKVCDWCKHEEINSPPSSRHGANSSSPSSARDKNKSGNANEIRSPKSGDKIKHHHRDEEGGSPADKATGKSPSPRTSYRKYKLLKDV